MLNQYEIDFGRIDYPALTPRDRDQLKSWAAQVAHDDRDETIRRAIRGLAVFLWKLPVRLFSAYRRWRRRKWTASELHALSDRTLTDIGVSRCEIDSLSFAGRA